MRLQLWGRLAQVNFGILHSIPSAILERGGHIKYGLVPVLFLTMLLVGCGNSLQPPKASVTIGNEHIQAVVNGYQWSKGNQSTVGDAASDPAKNLKIYNAPIGEKVTLTFGQQPMSIDITEWSNGQQGLTSALGGSSFKLPNEAGDYTCEVTGHWGNDYVNYDFEVQVH
jgi:hypothetical protein